MRQEFIELRKLLERDWTQGAFARDAAGHYVQPRDSTAVSFCIEGAMHRITGQYGKTFTDMNNIMIDQLRRETQETSIPHWNDARGRTKAEVLGFVDRVIASEASVSSLPLETVE